MSENPNHHPDRFMGMTSMMLDKMADSGMIEHRDLQARAADSWKDKTYEDETGRRFIYHGSRPERTWKKVPRYLA